MPWLFKQPASKNWWVGYRSGGRQFRHSTNSEDIKTAEAERDRIAALLKAKKSEMLTQSVIDAITERKAPRLTLKAEAEAWLTQCEHATDQSTAARYRGIVETFLRFMKADEDGPIISDLSTNQIRNHFNERLKVISPATANTERKILRMFFKHAFDIGALRVNPILPIKHFKVRDKSTRQPFTVKQLSSIFSAADHEWQFMVLCGFYTGLRMGDIATLEWCKVDWHGRMFNTRDEKTDKSLHIPIAPRLFDWLEKEFARKIEPTGYIVPGLAETYSASGSGALSNGFYKLMVKAGIPLPDRSKKHRQEKNGRSGRRTTNPLSFHSLRHSFISFLKNTGASQAVAKELAGHASDALSDLYTHVPLDALTDAVSKLPEFTP